MIFWRASCVDFVPRVRKAHNETSWPYFEPCFEIRRKVIEQNATVKLRFVRSHSDIFTRKMLCTPLNLLTPRHRRFARTFREYVERKSDFAGLFDDFEAARNRFQVPPEARLTLNQLPSSFDMRWFVTFDVSTFVNRLRRSSNCAHCLAQRGVVVGNRAVEVNERYAIVFCVHFFAESFFASKPASKSRSAMMRSSVLRSSSVVSAPRIQLRLFSLLISPSLMSERSLIRAFFAEP